MQQALWKAKQTFRMVLFRITVKSEMGTLHHSHTADQIFTQSTLRQSQCYERSLEIPTR